MGLRLMRPPPVTLHRPMTSSLLLVADGASVHTLRLAASAAALGWDVHLAAFEGPTVEGVQRHSLGGAPPSSDRRYLLAVPRLAMLIRSLSPSVVNAHYVSSYGALTRAALALNRGQRRPVFVVTAWGSDLLVTAASSGVRAAIARWTLRGADLVTGDSRDLRNAARALAPGAEWHDFVFGPEASLLGAFRGAASGILSARALVPAMRVELVVRAYERARQLAPDVMRDQRLTVVGDGERRNDVRSAATSGYVDVVGTLTRQDLHELMLQSAVLVSVPETDGSSATLLDGLAAGMKPVVNDLPANRQWVDEGIGEIVSRDPGVGELAGALVRAVSRDVPSTQIRERVAGVAWEDQVGSLLDTFRRRLG